MRRALAEYTVLGITHHPALLRPRAAPPGLRRRRLRHRLHRAPPGRAAPRRGRASGDMAVAAAAMRGAARARAGARRAGRPPPRARPGGGAGLARAAGPGAMIFDATVDGRTVRVEVRAGADGRYTVRLDGRAARGRRPRRRAALVSLLIADGRATRSGSSGARAATASCSRGERARRRPGRGGPRRARLPGAGGGPARVGAHAGQARARPRERGPGRGRGPGTGGDGSHEDGERDPRAARGPGEGARCAKARRWRPAPSCRPGVAAGAPRPPSKRLPRRAPARRGPAPALLRVPAWSARIPLRPLARVFHRPVLLGRRALTTCAAGGGHGPAHRGDPPRTPSPSWKCRASPSRPPWPPLFDRPPRADARRGRGPPLRVTRLTPQAGRRRPPELALRRRRGGREVRSGC